MIELDLSEEYEPTVWVLGDGSTSDSHEEILHTWVRCKTCRAHIHPEFDGSWSEKQP